MKNIFLLLTLLISTHALAETKPRCEYLGYSRGQGSYSPVLIDHCHYIKSPEGAPPIGVGCNLALKEGLMAVTQKILELESQGRCRIEIADCAVGSVWQPRNDSYGRSPKPRSKAIAAVWIDPSFEGWPTDFRASFRTYSFEGWTGWVNAIQNPSGALYCGNPGWETCGKESPDLGSALAEAKEALELLISQGICRRQQFPISCESYANYDDGPSVRYENLKGVPMAGRVGFYQNAGICK